VATAKDKPVPSTAADSKGLIMAQKDKPILNGRPFTAMGPPIAIYESAFSDFIAMNQEKMDVPIRPEDYQYVGEFIKASSSIYAKEKRRVEAIASWLHELLGSIFTVVTLEDDTSNDGIITGTGRNKSLLLIREVENEIGSSGDPCLQVGFSLTRWWASSQVEHTIIATYMALRLFRVLIFDLGHAAPASSSLSPEPGSVCKVAYVSVAPG
jgi:hypothetical protein